MATVKMETAPGGSVKLRWHTWFKKEKKKNEIRNTE